MNLLVWFDRLHKAGMAPAALPFAGLVGGESAMMTTHISPEPFDFWVGLGGAVLIGTASIMLAVLLWLWG